MLRPVSAILLILFSAAAAITLRAHPAPFSYLDVHIAADGLSGRLAIHDLDAAYELKLEDLDKVSGGFFRRPGPSYPFPFPLDEAPLPGRPLPRPVPFEI